MRSVPTGPASAECGAKEHVGESVALSIKSICYRGWQQSSQTGWTVNEQTFRRSAPLPMPTHGQQHHAAFCESYTGFRYIGPIALFDESMGRIFNEVHYKAYSDNWFRSRNVTYNTRCRIIVGLCINPEADCTQPSYLQYVRDNRCTGNTRCYGRRRYNRRNDQYVFRC